ncbi:hypothetical protein Tcan_18061 [Toxocara canis]|uniref:WH1 domain-containing protein n=1 Tax=Toxocara canis TaxID=6265 RepID=A0A0B2V8U7_TOXCA|nr:hypothetical protein Tcan_18061 [Toxocara canis]
MSDECRASTVGLNSSRYELITSVLVRVYLEDGGVWRELSSNESVFVHIYFDHNDDTFKLLSTDGVNVVGTPDEFYQASVRQNAVEDGVSWRSSNTTDESSSMFAAVSTPVKRFLNPIGTPRSVSQSAGYFSLLFASVFVMKLPGCLAPNGNNDMLINKFILSHSLTMVRSSKNFLYFTSGNCGPVYGLGFDQKEELLRFMTTVQGILKGLLQKMPSQSWTTQTSSTIPWSTVVDSAQTVASECAASGTLSSDANEDSVGGGYDIMSGLEKAIIDLSMLGLSDGDSTDINAKLN